MISKPLVSVVVPFLNGEKYIEEAIRSVFDQSYDAWELLLVDDGSTDRSTGVALRYAEQHPGRVRYFQHKGHENLGQSASRNLAIRHAKGQYIAFLDQDDIWLPHKLERQVAILNAQPEVAMVYGSAEHWFSWTGKPEDAKRDYVEVHGVQLNTVINPPTLLILLLHKIGVPCVCTVMIRRDALRHIGGFEDSFRGVFEDQVFDCKAFLNLRVLVAGESLAKYRLHTDSTSARTRHWRSDELAFLDWLGDYLSKQGVTNTGVWHAFHTYVHTMWRYRHSILYRLIPFLHGLLPVTTALPKREKPSMTVSPDPLYATIQTAPRYEGYHDHADCEMIWGWAWETTRPNSPVEVDVFIDNSLLTTLTADEFRPDIVDAGKGNGYHGFWYAMPPWLKDGKSHSIRLRFSRTDIDLDYTPKIVNCELQIASDIRGLTARLQSHLSKRILFIRKALSDFLLD